MATKTYTFIYRNTESGNAYYYKKNAIQEIKDTYEYASQYSDEEIMDTCMNAGKIERIKLVDTKRDGGLDNPINAIPFGLGNDLDVLLGSFHVTATVEEPEEEEVEVAFDGLFHARG